MGYFTPCNADNIFNWHQCECFHLSIFQLDMSQQRIKKVMRWHLLDAEANILFSLRREGVCRTLAKLKPNKNRIWRMCVRTCSSVIDRDVQLGEYTIFNTLNMNLLSPFSSSKHHVPQQDYGFRNHCKLHGRHLLLYFRITAA